MGARYYAPSLGRWISEDAYRGEISDPLSLNLYVFCINNPLIYVDPSGFSAVDVTQNFVGDPATINALKVSVTAGLAVWWEPVSTGVAIVGGGMLVYYYVTQPGTVNHEADFDYNAFLARQEYRRIKGGLQPGQIPNELEIWKAKLHYTLSKGNPGGGNNKGGPDWGTAIPLSYILSSHYDKWEYWLLEFAGEIAGMTMIMYDMHQTNREIRELLDSKNIHHIQHNESIYSWFDKDDLWGHQLDGSAWWNTDPGLYYHAPYTK